jgi:hypothetical protein
MGTPGGRGAREGNRYRLLAGVQEDSPVASPRREILGENRQAGAGGKRTLDERSPGTHGLEERVGRLRKDNGEDRRNGGTDERSSETRTESEIVDHEMGGENADRIAEIESEIVRTEVSNRVKGSGKRIDEFMLGDIFSRIEDKAEADMASFIKHLPEEVREPVRQGMSILLEGIKSVMSGVSDAVASEGYERRLSDTEMVSQIEELRQEVKEVKRAADNWAGEESLAKVKASEKEMERKVSAACSHLKYLDIDIGYATDDKKDMVRQVVNVLRGDTFPDDRNRFDRTMRKTRIVLLGKKTEVRKERGRTIHTVPVLLELQSRQDTDELEAILRRAGYFSAFHWPSEIKEFVSNVREGLVGDGFGEGFFIRIRPEEKGGEVLIRADVKRKDGGKFQTKGFWKCPPVEKAFWSMITGLYVPLTSEQLRR